MGRHSFRGFDATTVDLRLSRTITLDRWKIELMAEAFNVLNHTNFPTAEHYVRTGSRTGGDVRDAAGGRRSEADTVRVPGQFLKKSAEQERGTLVPRHNR
jgi:hypothetical protein